MPIKTTSLHELIEQAEAEIKSAFAIDLKKYEENPPMTAGKVQSRQDMKIEFCQRVLGIPNESNK